MILEQTPVYEITIEPFATNSKWDIYRFKFKLNNFLQY